MSAMRVGSEVSPNASSRRAARIHQEARARGRERARAEQHTSRAHRVDAGRGDDEPARRAAAGPPAMP
jgi:hypothetical protein